jgi:DNA (cytosine-5)-methyltransferase 1
MTIKFIELCSGCGGLSSGFLRVDGFYAELLNDKDKICCETLKLNHSNILVHCGSMNEIDYSSFNNIDLLMGGVPCQSFSTSGLKKGLNDDRGQLIIDFCKIVKKIEPKVFLIENVKGLLHHNKGQTLETILNELDVEKYNIQYQILNANDFGVAQNRKRLFIVGYKKELFLDTYKFPLPHSTKLVLKDVLRNVPLSEGYKYSEQKEKIMNLIPQGGCWIHLPKELQQEYMKKSFFSSGGKRGIARRLSMNEPSLTLTTSPNQTQTERCHPLETRPLTIREYARIQSFPDSYKFYGSIAQQYKQIGNAVPVNLAECIANSIKKLFQSYCGE